MSSLSPDCQLFIPMNPRIRSRLIVPAEFGILVGVLQDYEFITNNIIKTSKFAVFIKNVPTILGQRLKLVFEFGVFENFRKDILIVEAVEGPLARRIGTDIDIYENYCFEVIEIVQLETRWPFHSGVV